MNGFKNSCFLLAVLFFIPNGAAAREKIYLVPPVQLLPLKKMETNSYGLIIGAKNDVLNENLWQNGFYRAFHFENGEENNSCKKTIPKTVYNIDKTKEKMYNTSVMLCKRTRGDSIGGL